MVGVTKQFIKKLEELFVVLFYTRNHRADKEFPEPLATNWQFFDKLLV